MATEAAAVAPKSWFGQPRGLTILFLTEMWEQFSFYGMRTLLVYYMTKQLLLAPERASLVYGLYTAFVYFTPIIGGQISDRWLGRRRSVILGGSIMALGHFMMASEPLFYVALLTIVLGNGLFLPSLPSQINGLYAPSDPRRASAYNVYYVGINLGAFLAPLVCGTLGEVYGWHWGFTAAGVGMVSGLTIYVLGGRHLPPEPPRAAVAAVESPRSADAKRSLMLLLAIGLVVVIFRGAYAQTGNTIALFIDQGVDRMVGGGLAIPMTWFQSLNPLLVFALTPFLVARWNRTAAKGRDVSSALRMGIGAFLVGASFLLLAAAAAAAQARGESVSWVWVVAFFVILTVGELYILPVGLGLFARLAPPRFGATTVAGWFFAAFGGYLLGGFLGALFGRLAPAPFFALMAALCAVAGGLLLVLARAARRVEAQHAADSRLLVELG